MTIERNGFLGDKVNQISSEIQKAHKPYFSLFSKLNRFTAETREKISTDNTNLLELLATCLFIRIHESCQAAVLLLRNGLTTDAKVVVRSVFEALAHIKLLSKDEKYTKQYMLASEFERSRKITKLRQNPSDVLAKYRDKISPEEMAKFEKQRKELKDARHITSKIATEAGLKDMYETVYSLFSDIVHVSSKTLENYLVLNEKGDKIVSFQWGPRKNNEIRDLLLLINSFIINMLGAADMILKLDLEQGLKPLADEQVRLSEENLKKEI